MRLALAGGAVIAIGAGIVGVARISAAQDGGPSRWGPNPADADPRAPQNNRQPGIHHDPDEIAVCGKRWRDVYVAEDGTIAVTHGDPGGGCHVLTKEELERNRELDREGERHPAADIRVVP